MIQHFVHEYCYIAEDYFEELRAFENVDHLTSMDTILQYPYIAEEEKSAEELAEMERKKEQNRQRMREQAAKQRQEKLNKKEEQLVEYRLVKALNEAGTKVEFKVSSLMLNINLCIPVLQSFVESIAYEIWFSKTNPTWTKPSLFWNCPLRNHATKCWDFHHPKNHQRNHPLFPCSQSPTVR